MTQRHKRAAGLIVIATFGAWLIYLGDSWTINFAPAHWWGSALCFAAALGAIGVNIWIGGPLDPRRDPRPQFPRERAGDKPTV